MKIRKLKLRIELEDRNSAPLEYGRLVDIDIPHPAIALSKVSQTILEGVEKNLQQIEEVAKKMKVTDETPTRRTI